jgi:hypothetical protein
MSTVLYKKTDIGDVMNKPKPLENGYRSRIRTNILRLARWNGAWVAATR